MANDRAAQEIAIAQREATRIAHERAWSRPKVSALAELRMVARRVAERTGLEVVEAAKTSECHELLSEIVG